MPEGTGLELLRSVLSWSRDRDYVGWDYADGASSRLLSALPFDSGWLTLAVQETVKRAPVNLRPLFLVEQRANFMGTALFAMANLTTHRLTGEDRFLADALTLGNRLLTLQSDRVPEFAGCHRHDLQGLDGRTPAGTPGIVGTSYGVRALLRLAECADRPFDDVAHTAADFPFEHLDYSECPDGARIRYKPTETGDYYTLNANALGARTLLDLHADRPSSRLREGATKILDYVVSRQTDVGGWYYRDPPGASHLSMDSHHNGFIIESLVRYEEVVGDGRYDDAIADALAFYRDLFEPDGVPRFDESEPYPRDIHASSQGVIVFARCRDLATARRILDWAREHLYAGDGRFYFRKHRYHTKRTTLMRWCQAWMAFAVAEYLAARDLRDEPGVEP
ncbi:antibiotic ABC transporter permease [Halobacteriales archaeon QS_8_69_26]|nr:MAG: antibiotic ABC transporter permease [Halobacteriales archaeon QS_8_69_26]